MNQMSKYDKDIFGIIKGSGEVIDVTFYGGQTKQAIGLLSAGIEIFLGNFTDIFEHPKFKGVVFQIDGLTNHVNYVNQLKKRVRPMEIPHIFMSSNEHMLTSIVVAANVDVNFGEAVVVVLVDENDYVVTELTYTSKGYKEGEQRDCSDVKAMYPPTIRKRILGPNNPAKVILHANTPGLPSMKLLKEKALKKDGEKVIILEENYHDYEPKLMLAIVKWLLDKSFTKFYVLPLAYRTYMIGFECGGVKHPIIICKKGDVLPFKKTVVVSKSPLQYFVSAASNFF